jgi:hypothetical protein
LIDLKGYNGFALANGDTSFEANRLSLYCSLNDIPCIRVKNCPDNFVPSGSVEWCLKQLGKEIIPDYYPDWLSSYFNRKVWKEDKWPIDKKVFIKPSDKYKRFTGKAIFVGSYKGKKRGPYWCSEIVSFENEWRYYISNGKVLCGEWYWGDEINTPKAPNIDHIHIPIEFCGTLDFGMMKVNETIPYKFTLIEVHHPFSCGWYGKQEDDYIYFQWLVDGWKYMKEI